MDRQDDLNGEELEEVRTAIPGPRTRELAGKLRRVESRNVTFVDERFPVFWESSCGANVTDVDGNRYIDLTAGFGVAGTGHSNPRVAAAIAEQAGRMMHAMGDVHPAEAKVSLLEKLAAITPGGLSKTFLASTGAEAVEAAMKTAIIATGKSRFVAFRGAYHGLSFGALEICGIEKFRDPFRTMLPDRAHFLDFPQSPDALDDVRQVMDAGGDVAAVFIEPVQARGGNYVAPDGYLRGLRELCTTRGVLLICDEIYTGFGRTGQMFACDWENVAPDILCIGKAMANGFPISAAVAAPNIMDAWPESPGEALHTSTYLGNPMACAAALANIGEIERLKLPQRARELGSLLEERLTLLCANHRLPQPRGRGLLWGFELEDGARASKLVKDALRNGIIVLQAGPLGNVVSIAPPLVISRRQLFACRRRSRGVLMTYKVGLVGSGFGVRAHLPAYNAHPQFEVVAIASPHSAAGIAKQRGIASFTSCAELLSEADVDIVDVSAPPFTHHRDVLDALAAGKHVICEKPFALNVAQAQEMAAAASASGKATAVMHEFRWVPQRMAIKELIVNEHLTPLREIEIVQLSTNLRAEDTSRPRGWWFERERGGGMAGALLSHAIDCATWWAGRPPVRSTGYLRTANPERRDSEGQFTSTSDDGAFALVDYGDGLVARLCVDGTVAVESATYAAHAENRTAVASGLSAIDLRLFSVDTDETAELECKPSPYQKFAAVDPLVPLVMQLLDEFLKQIETGAGDVPTFAEAVETQKVLESIGYAT